MFFRKFEYIDSLHRPYDTKKNHFNLEFGSVFYRLTLHGITRSRSDIKYDNKMHM